MIKCKNILLALGIGIFGCSVLQAQSGLIEKIDWYLIKNKEERNAACKKEIGKLIGTQLLDKVDPHNKYKSRSYNAKTGRYEDVSEPYCDFLETLKEGDSKNNIVKGCYYGVDVKYDFEYDAKGRVLQYNRMCTSVSSIVKVTGNKHYIQLWNVKDQASEGPRYSSTRYANKAVVEGCQSVPVKCPGERDGKYYPVESVVVTDIGKKEIPEIKKNQIKKFFTTSASPKVVERVLKLVKDYTTEVQICSKNAEIDQRWGGGGHSYHTSTNGALHIKGDKIVYDRDGKEIVSAKEGVFDDVYTEDEFPNSEPIVHKNMESFDVKCK